jgi:ribosome-interacting GTPase 1
MLDATKSHEQRRLLEIELDAVGIRLNKSKPDVVFKQRSTGGVSLRRYYAFIEDQHSLKHIDNREIMSF